jgi:hypothetical protein
LNGKPRTTTHNRGGGEFAFGNKRPDECRAREWTSGDDEAVLIHILPDRVLEIGEIYLRWCHALRICGSGSADNTTMVNAVLGLYLTL